MFKCLECGGEQVVISESDGSDHIDDLGRYHLSCKKCGIHTGKWKDPKKVKEVFPDNPEYW